MDDHQVLAQINSLVAEEHELREQRQAGDLGSDEERARLTQLEQALDQCWDLLRQRRARKEFGQNESDATVRPVEEVENYLQ
ncbi:MAG TPA: DUF2630 family protein [Nakamurella sp.]